MKFKFLVVAMSAALSVGCASNATIQYAPEQTKETNVTNRASSAEVAKSALEFEDSDITVPSYFDTQGLERCNFDKNNEADDCPLKKPIIRVYFDGNDVTGKGKGVEALQGIDNLKLVQMFENQVAGLNRFRIVTRDEDVVNLEKQAQLAEQGAVNVAKKAAKNRTLQPDFVLKIDTVKTADSFYAEYNGQAEFTLEMTSAVIDPYTKEKLSQPNIGKIRVLGTDVRAKKELVFSEVNGKYYTGFDYTDPNNVQSVMNDMASRGFDIMLTRLLSEMPSTAQVLGIKENQVSLDRGRNAGILPNETMIVFQYEAGFVDPIGVATISPSKAAANGQIVLWKESKLSKQVRKGAEGGIYRPPAGVKLFAVSVGTPADFLKKRT